MTTVSKKVRRLGRFDWHLAGKAIRANRPTLLAVNGLDYLSYSDCAVASVEQLSLKSKQFLSDMQGEFSVPVRFNGVGPTLNCVVTSEPSWTAEELPA